MQTLHIKLSDRDRELLESAAEVAKCSVSDVVRDALVRCGFRLDGPVRNVMTPPDQHAMLVPSPERYPEKEEKIHVD